MSGPISTMATLAAGAASEGGGDSSWVLGLLACLGIYVLVRGVGAKNWVRWEYPGQDGRIHTTDWYDADTHYVWEDPHDPTYFEVRQRGES